MKIDVNICESHYVNLLFLWTSSIVQVFHFLTFDIFLTTCHLVTFWQMKCSRFWRFLCLVTLAIYFGLNRCLHIPAVIVFLMQLFGYILFRLAFLLIVFIKSPRVFLPIDLSSNDCSYLDIERRYHILGGRFLIVFEWINRTAYVTFLFFYYGVVVV